MNKSIFHKILLILFVGLISLNLQASSEKSNDKEFNLKEFALHHVKDSHTWHIMDIGEKEIYVPLPVILWDNGLVTFSSSEFEHEAVAEANGNYYKLYHEKIYKTDASGNLNMDAEGHPTNVKPLDFSITKNTFSMIIACIIIFVIMFITAKSYKNEVPKGLAKFMEPLIVFVRDDIVRANIDEDKYKRFLPYLLTVFFFIWINNLIGLLPIPPGGGANVTGNIAVTLVLALFTFFFTNFYGNKHYWKHIFDPLGSSFPMAGKIPLYLILVPVELLGVLTKPFALMIRLFANITAGHIIVLSLTSLIFLFGTLWVAPVSILFVLFMLCIEFLVAFLQAYIFTLLSSLFIGLAVNHHGHEHSHAHEEITQI